MGANDYRGQQMGRGHEMTATACAVLACSWHVHHINKVLGSPSCGVSCPYCRPLLTDIQSTDDRSCSQSIWPAKDHAIGSLG